jgi:hypothetical protein
VGADGAIAIPNYAFVTSATAPAVFQSLDAADQICATAAAASQLPGRFRAWLSTTTTNAIDRLQGARGWIRTDGAPFADTLDDIGAGRIFNPLRLDERGAIVSGIVLTGTDVAGRAQPTSDCNDWSDGATGDAVAGTTEGTTSVWTSVTTIRCSDPARLYCFGVDRVAAVAPPPAIGKLAFLSDEPFTVGGGLAAADAQCQREAASAGLPGTFRALLSSPGATAAARVHVNLGAAWVRVDGVPVNAGGTDAFFDASDMLAPLNVTSSKRYMDANVFTGASGPNAPGDVAQTCNNWAAGASATVGRASYMPSWFATGAPSPCATVPADIYCFQAD